MKNLLNRNLVIGMMLLTSLTAFTGCGSSDAGTTSTDSSTNTNTTTQSQTSGDATSTTQTNDTMTGQIVVVSREEGSGTRGAFVELIEVVDDSGNDITTFDAIIHSSTGNVMTEVSNTPNAIGYISLGSLNSTVTAVDVDGVSPSMDNILSGEYTVARPFNIATKEEPTGLTADFIGFIMSEQGQSIVESEGLIPLDYSDYESDGSAGSIVVGGSTSIYSVMEKLSEAYADVNPNASISIEGGGSSTGMNSAMDGTFDIGMASRELKDSETAELWYMTMAQDGIAVIVNNSNPTNDITSTEIKDIYLGDTTDWSDIG